MSSDNRCVIERQVLPDKAHYAHYAHYEIFASSDEHVPTGPVNFFWLLEDAIHWHNLNCTPEYGLDVRFNLEDVMTNPTLDVKVSPDDLKVQTYDRKVFSVEAIRVTDTNIDVVAQWCNGKVTTTREGVPFIEVPTGRTSKMTHNRAFIGYWVVTGIEGFFTSYSDRSFHRTFEGR